MHKFLHFLFIGENPFRLGFWAALVWLVPVVLLGLYFATFEPLGIKHYRGMVPLTAVLRCVPGVVWIAFFVWFVPHVLKHHQ